MENIKNWSEVFLTSLQNLWFDIVGALPQILAAIVLMLLGWLIARLARSLSIRVLKLIRFDRLTDRAKVKAFLKKAQIKSAPNKLIAQFVYWVVLLVFLVVISETLGWKVVSVKIAAILGYIPQLLAGVLIFVVGFYVSTIVKRAIAAAASSFEISSGRILSNVAFYILMVIITITTLDQIGIDVSLIKSNMIIIVGGIMLAFAVSYGFGSRNIVSNMLASFYGRRHLRIGQDIVSGSVQGTVIAMDNQSVTLVNENGKIVIPADQLYNQPYTISPDGNTRTTVK